ncbi:MAG TPA: hypothetical protein VFY87_18720 [Geminicoccaceae bacterium]|nr:hypothetical protein [Geminicoccaceae bacterium]
MADIAGRGGAHLVGVEVRDLAVQAGVPVVAEAAPGLVLLAAEP